MKVLQISANWGSGGPGGVEKDLFNILKEKGYECIVAYGRGTIPKSITSIKIGNKFGVYLHAFLSRIFDNCGFCSSFATRSLIKKIKRINPDIIQIHNLLGYYINVKILFSFLKTYGKPIVWTIHDCWALTGHCINFERIACDKWLYGCSKCPLRKDYPPSFVCESSKKNWQLKRKTFSDVPQMELVCPSKWMSKNIMLSSLSCYPTHVINNGIDLQVFHCVKTDLREQYHLEGKIILLAVAGTWNEMKGERLLYQIAEMLDQKYVLVMIGKKSLKCPDSIINIARTENAGILVEWYSAADIFINPTLGDNFPTVNLEALACGLPIVTNATGGSVEVINGKVGKIVYSKTAEEFVSKIQECACSNISKSSCIEEAQKYDKLLCYSRYLSIYERLIKQNKGD